MGVVKVSLEVNVKYLVLDLGLDNICVNVILVGLICILSVKGVGGFNIIFKEIEECVFLKCNVD